MVKPKGSSEEGEREKERGERSEAEESIAERRLEDLPECMVVT